MENGFFFPPYKGKLYGNPESAFGRTRVLALGHSHYCEREYNRALMNLRIHKNRRIIRCDKNCANYGSELCSNRTGKWTTDAAINYINYMNKTAEKDKTSIFSKFAHILNMNGNEVKCWESLAQYNFLQAAVGELNRGGNSVEIEFSRILIAKAFKELEPDIIIAWSEQKVFNHIFKYLPAEFMWTPGNYNFPCGTIRIGDKTAKVIGIPHPSSRVKQSIAIERIKTIAPELINQ